MAARKENTIHEDHKSLLSGVQGLIMNHPIHFLGDEPLTVREGIMSVDLFQ